MSVVLGLLGLIGSLGILLIQPNSKESINSKIKELDNIKIALSTLNSYVENQQKVLSKISFEKLTIEQEKDKIQKALEIDKGKLDALLEYQISQTKRSKWLEILISFFIGVLSSSLVTFFAIKYQREMKINDEIISE